MSHACHCCLTFLQCDNIEVTGAPSVAIILNKTPSTWGGESGANIKGVAVGISWDEKTTTDGLTATDIVRYRERRTVNFNWDYNIDFRLGLPWREVHRPVK